MSPKGVYLPADVAQKILDYLAKRPYEESADLIFAFHEHKKIVLREPK